MSWPVVWPLDYKNDDANEGEHGPKVGPLVNGVRSLVRSLREKSVQSVSVCARYRHFQRGSADPCDFEFMAGTVLSHVLRQNAPPHLPTVRGSH